ncbi:MAG: hypothetical protein VB980_00230, partial [Opitutales bacterium]
MGSSVKAEPNASQPSASSGEADSVVEPLAPRIQPSPSSSVEVNATTRFKDLRVKVTHDPNDEDKFTLDL